MNKLTPKQFMVLGMVVVDLCLASGPVGLRGALAFAGAQLFGWGLIAAIYRSVFPPTYAPPDLWHKPKGSKANIGTTGDVDE